MRKVILAAMMALFAMQSPVSTTAACPQLDINLDESVDVVDAQCLFQVVLAASAGHRLRVRCYEVSWARLDLNCDQAVNISDFQIMMFAVVNLGWLPPFIDSDEDGCVDSCQ